jgi:hypothetical protein
VSLDAPEVKGPPDEGRCVRDVSYDYYDYDSDGRGNIMSVL